MKQNEIDEWLLEKERRERESEKLKSPCLPGRLRHYFAHRGARSPTLDSPCRWCGKTLRQVRKEQRRAAAR